MFLLLLTTFNSLQFPDSISIEFSQDFIATVTPKPWSTMPHYYPKPLRPSSTTEQKSGPIAFFAGTINRLNLCAAGYVLVTRFLALRTKLAETDSTSSWLAPLSFFKKAKHYSSFAITVTVALLEVILVHLCMKYLVSSSCKAFSAISFMVLIQLIACPSRSTLYGPRPLAISSNAFL